MLRHYETFDYDMVTVQSVALVMLFVSYNIVVHP